MDDLAPFAQIDIDNATAESRRTERLTAADQIGLLVEIDEQLDIRRHATGERRRIETEHQRDRYGGASQILGHVDRRICAGGMTDQHDRRRRAAIACDDLTRKAARCVHGVHTRLDTALLDPRGKIVEAEREYLS